MKNDLPLLALDAAGHAPAHGLLEDGVRARVARDSTPGLRDFLDVEREAKQLRARVIGQMLVRAFDWIERKATAVRRREHERYLAESTDLADLERRMRQLGNDVRLRG